GGSLSRLRPRVYYYQRWTGVQNDHHHIFDLPELLFVRQTGHRRGAVFPHFNFYLANGFCLYSFPISAGGATRMTLESSSASFSQADDPSTGFTPRPEPVEGSRGRWQAGR